VVTGQLDSFRRASCLLFGEACIVDITKVNRAAIIEQLKQTQEMLAKLLALLEAGVADKCAAHLYQPCRAIPRHL
jgi:hypothetical protein